jgi:hypothetical protein
MPRSFTAAHQITNPGSPFNTFIVASPTVTTRRQVEMVPHQDPRMHPPPVARANLSESVKKSLSGIIILENDLSPVTARHHMINRTGVLESVRSGHLPVYQAQRHSARSSMGSVLADSHDGSSLEGLFIREQDFCQLTPPHCQVLVGAASGKEAVYGPRMPHDQTRCDPVVADAGRLTQNTCQDDLRWGRR